MRRAAVILLLLGSGSPASPAAAPPGEEAIRLRNEGVAQLENEQPASAEGLFRKLITAVPDDPLGYANLAIALLRQQQFDEARKWIGVALEKAPGRPDLLAIRAEIEQWGGDPVASLALYRRAAAAAAEDPTIQYALYRAATTLAGGEGEAAADEALERLVRLRPENLVVVLQRGLRAREAGDRAAATAAFLRIRELAWQAPPAAEQLLGQILDALEASDLEAARVPAMRLGNLLKVTPMHRESQRELSVGIQGTPVERFRDEPPRTAFGDPVPVSFLGARLSAEPSLGRALAAADLDGDGRPEIARLVGGGSGPALELRRSADGWADAELLPAPQIDGLLAADLDNDGHLDLIGYGDEGVRFWRGGAEGRLGDATAELGLGSARGSAATVIDFDIEGDLDLALATEGGMELYRNALQGELEAVGSRVFPPIQMEGVRELLSTDLDRDGDLDLLIAHAGGVVWLDNLRQGRFADRTAAAGLDRLGAARAAVSADLDNDGLLDLALAGDGLTFLRNAGDGRFEPWQPGGPLGGGATLNDLATLDLDNDGRLDLAAAADRALVAMAQRPSGGFEFLNLEAAPAGAAALATADLDGDGDLDLVAAGEEGLFRLENRGGNRNRWMSVRLRGLDKGNSKNNLFGLGATVEIVAGDAYQLREAQSEVTHVGLGEVATPDLLRVVWTNGVPQNRLAPPVQQTIVEEQVLKGSCPFLYAWDGERIRFVTDLLWGSPAGLPLAPGIWAPADPREIVAVEGAVPIAGVYDLRITEELWEAAFFDRVRLWVVDHPEGTEVASSLKIVPGEAVPERVLATRGLRPVAAAWDARGREVGDRVARRDEIYADGWRPSRYQGVAAETWSFTFDLGEAPAAPVRLHLDGWIFPTDASLNLALAQRGYRPVGPRLEVETADGWRTLVERPGFPAGKTKTMVVDTPPLPEGARRLRIVSSLWLSWDRIAWSTSPADAAARRVAILDPASAELRYRGFSKPMRQAPNAPHVYDYTTVDARSPWLPFPGSYTRFGDVRELLAAEDDRSVILGAGDELALRFDASSLPPPPAGWRRALFLESSGWDKDADRNTWEPNQLEPLPFGAMSGYPWGADEAFPDTPLHRDYRRSWLTREVDRVPTGAAPPPASASAPPAREAVERAAPARRTDRGS